jgi:hypothetical protein
MFGVALLKSLAGLTDVNGIWFLAYEFKDVYLAATVLLRFGP